MGVDVAQWRSSIGRFTQQTTRRRAGHRRASNLNLDTFLVVLNLLILFSVLHSLLQS
jgi:hypothetical protein